jgi:hypothetical protein
MEAYGVPEDLDGVLPWSWALERLTAARNFWIATADATGRPHALPVWGAWVEAAPEPDAPNPTETTDRFWFSCAPTARKARNLAANPQIVVATEDTVEVVSIEGRAVALQGDAAEDGVLAAKYGGLPEMDGVEQMAGFLRENAMYAVTPQRGFGVIERPEDFGPRATRWQW